MYGVFDRKEILFLRIQKIIHSHDTAIKNGQLDQWSWKIKIYMIYF